MKSSRLFSIQKILNKDKLDGLFLTNQQNVSYLTGFSGLSANERECFLFLTSKKAVLFTFPTYFGLFKESKNSFKVACITPARRLSEMLTELVCQNGIKSMGFESENLTVAELTNLQNKVKVKWKPVQNFVENERIIKSGEELELVKFAAKITDNAFEFIKTKIRPGVSEKDLALELEIFLKRNAGDVAFSPIVAFNENAAIPHYLPSKDQRLKTNSLILLDFGAKFCGYCADMTRVVFWGNPSARQIKIYSTVLKAQEKALSILKPGISGGQVDRVARNFVSRSGFEPYPHGLGHGVGLAIHEAPRLKIKSDEILKENMVVTVEPGIYLDGECGVRIEDLVVLKPGGIEILTKSPKKLSIINNR